MTETKTTETRMIVPEIYNYSNDYVTLDLEGHKELVGIVAKKYPMLTKIIMLSDAPLLLKVSAFEHFLFAPLAPNDTVSRWLLDFTNACVYEGEDTKMLYDDVPFDRCLAFVKTICKSVHHTVATSLGDWDLARISFKDALCQYPEWFDNEAWSSEGNDWYALKNFLGREFTNMAQVLYMLYTGTLTEDNRRYEQPAMWTMGWLKKARVN